MGMVQLPKLDGYVSARRTSAQWLLDRLERHSDVLQVQSETAGGDHSWFGFPITISANAPFDVDDITTALNRKCIETRPIICGNIARQPGLQMYPHRVHGDLTHSDAVMARGFSFGNHQDIDSVASAYIADVIDAFPGGIVMPKTRALITGITGMVGSHLVEFLLEATDWDIDGMCRWRSPLDNLESLIPGSTRPTGSGYYTATYDTLAVQDVVRKSTPDYVFHLAAQSYPRTSLKAHWTHWIQTFRAPPSVLDALRLSAPGAIVHVCASSEVFGRVPKDKIPIDEECGFHPASPYAISKVGTDLIGRYYAEAYDMTVMTTRMFTHTGPRRGDVFAESTFAKQIALIEADLIPPVLKVGNLDSLRRLPTYEMRCALTICW